jgi:hypothetical protein
VETLIIRRMRKSSTLAISRLRIRMISKPALQWEVLRIFDGGAFNFHFIDCVDALNGAFIISAVATLLAWVIQSF